MKNIKIVPKSSDKIVTEIRFSKKLNLKPFQKEQILREYNYFTRNLKSFFMKHLKERGYKEEFLKEENYFIKQIIGNKAIHADNLSDNLPDDLELTDYNIKRMLLEHKELVSIVLGK